jgi:enoyl-CoA hydratase
VDRRTDGIERERSQTHDIETGVIERLMVGGAHDPHYSMREGLRGILNHKLRKGDLPAGAKRPGMDPSIVLERDGAIATITLNRPAVLNALNAELLGRLDDALGTIAHDATVRALIITGAGERAFAAGADISELALLDGPVAGTALARRGQLITQRIEALRVPVIAAVNGFALGGGCELALACDIRIASDNAKFGQPEVNLGIPPGYGGTQRMARLLGRGAALLLCTTGTIVDAAEALRIGLVQRVVPLADLIGEARAIAGAIAAKAPLAVTASKRAILDGASLAMSEALALEALHFGSLVGTHDFREGTSAFLAKRAPAFEGR